MDGRTIQEVAHDRAQELPGAELGHPFGEDWDVYKVRGKVFMLLTDVPGEPMVTLKSRPEDSAELRRAYDCITPGYHMNKRHWITLRAGDLDDQLVEDLVTESYLLVVEGLRRDLRPVDPATFGQP